MLARLDSGSRYVSKLLKYLWCVSVCVQVRYGIQCAYV